MGKTSYRLNRIVLNIILLFNRYILYMYGGIYVSSGQSLGSIFIVFIAGHGIIYDVFFNFIQGQDCLAYYYILTAKSLTHSKYPLNAGCVNECIK